MNAEETAEKAKPFDEGDELYQQRARAALPLLVRQAKAQQIIFYADLAKELGVHHRTLNFVLGSIGQTLLKLARMGGGEIPPIECLVVNQAEGLPGEGVAFFIGKEAYREMSKRQRRIVVDGQLQKIFAYPGWDSVLSAFSLQPAPQDFSKAVREAATGGRGGGESAEHRCLKEHVAAHPAVLRLPKSIAKGVNEYGLPSGDELDVLFRHGDEWIAVEVKSHISDDADVVRGLFQCVKYHAVLEAFLLSTGRPPNARAVLVLSRRFPATLLPLKNMLGIEVIEISPPI